MYVPFGAALPGVLENSWGEKKKYVHLYKRTHIKSLLTCILCKLSLIVGVLNWVWIYIVKKRKEWVEGDNFINTKWNKCTEKCLDKRRLSSCPGMKFTFSAKALHKLAKNIASYFVVAIETIRRFPLNSFSHQQSTHSQACVSTFLAFPLRKRGNCLCSCKGQAYPLPSIPFHSLHCFSPSLESSLYN